MENAPASIPQTGMAIPLKPAQYGRACTNCAKAKCRCLMRNGSSTCERCIRLKSNCTSSEITRKRATKAVVTARLEEKVDGILSLLKSKAVPEVEAVKITQEEYTPKSTDFTLHGLDFRLGENASHNGDLEKSTDASATLDTNIRNFANFSFMGPLPSFEAVPMDASSHSSQPVQTPITNSSSPASFTFEISPSEAENYLNYFRTRLLPGFAFIHIAPQTTAQSLENTRPFLFLAIMMVSSPPTSVSSQRRRLGQEIKERVAREILSEKEGNLDVLLGLLVFLTWGHDQLLATHLVSRFTQLAISMLFDLRLNKPPPRETATYSIFNLGAHDDGGQRERTMEERRATLGCWLLSSFISWYFVKIDPLRWTPYMDECLHLLSHAPESSDDTVFATQVSLQLVAEKTAHFTSSITKSGVNELEQAKASLPFYIYALNAEMRKIQLDISVEHSKNATLQSYIQHTILSISALALSPQPTTTSASPQNLTTHPSSHILPTSLTSRLTSLTACLTSLQSFFAFYFAILPSEYPTIAFPRFTHLAHAIVVLYHLTVLDEEGWDRKGVKQTCDIEEVLKGLVNCFGSLRRVPETDSGGAVGDGEASYGDKNTEEGIDMPAKLAWVFEKAGVWVRGKLALLEAKDQVRSGANRNLDGDMKIYGNGKAEVEGLETGQMDTMGTGLNFGDEDVAMMNGFDEAWLSEIFGPWNYDFM